MFSVILVITVRLLTGAGTEDSDRFGQITGHLELHSAKV